MSKVDRSVLRRDGVRAAVRAAGNAHLLMSDADVARSLAGVMAGHAADSPVWVFGYGSLIWNPLMEYAERRAAYVHGYHRGFYVWSKVNRGSPETPGLVLGLDRGGCCHGVAYRLHAASLREDLELLWRREMIGGTYMPRWVNAELEDRRVRAIAFTVNRSKPGYTGRMSDEQIIAVASRAVGHYGSCADYLTQTAHSLETQGLPDRRLSRLARMLRKNLKT